VFNLGTATAGVVTSTFQLCWSHDASYSFRLGSFQISGPFNVATECTLSELCTIQLSGVGLSSSNAVRIVESTSACGDDVAGVGSFSGLSATTSATSAAAQVAVFSVAPLGATGGTSGSRYRLCYAHSPAANTDYSFEVGTFTLNGPLVQEIDCPLTAHCLVQLTGTGLRSTNKVRVVSSGQLCSTSASTPVGYAGAIFATYLYPGAVSTFDLGTATTGEASAGYQLCFAHDSSHSFRVGTFQISGPLTGATSCTLSETCSIQLAGVGLASTNVVRILRRVMRVEAGRWVSARLWDSIQRLRWPRQHHTTSTAFRLPV
jgi:hypothetical protein